MTDLTIYEKVEIDTIDFSKLDIAQITAGIKSLQEQAGLITGRALKYISDNKLFKDDYKTFANYVESEFGMNRTQLYDNIRFVDTYELLCPAGHILPTAEKQTRPLSKIKNTEEKVTIWKEATKDGKIPTETVVKDLVKEYLDSLEESNEVVIIPVIPMISDYTLLELEVERLEVESNYTTIYTMVDVENPIQPTLKNEDIVVNDALETELKELKAELKKSKEAIRNLLLNRNKENTVPAFTPPANFTPPTFSSPAVENDRVVELEAELKELVANYQKDMQYQENKLEELKAENDQLRKQLNLKPKQIDNKEFTKLYVKEREAKRAAERVIFGMNPDGTPKK